MAISNEVVKRLKSPKFVSIILILLFLSGTITLVVISMLGKGEKFPNDIDIIVHDKGRQRWKYQIRAIRTYMSFINNIYVMDSTGTISNEDKESINDPEIPQKVTFIPGSEDIEEAFQQVGNIKNLNPYFIFFTDQVFPGTHILKTYFYKGDKPRMFNASRDITDSGFYLNFLEPTIPVLVSSVEILRKVETLENFIFYEMTEEDVVVHPDLNKDIVLNSNMKDNAVNQIGYLKYKTPLFITFHIFGDNQAEMNSLVVDYLKECYNDT